MHENINLYNSLGSVLLRLRVSRCNQLGLWQSDYGGVFFLLVKIEFLGKDEVSRFQSLLFIYLLSIFPFCIPFLGLRSVY